MFKIEKYVNFRSATRENRLLIDTLVIYEYI